MPALSTDMPKSSPIDQARRWCKERVDAECYVVLSNYWPVVALVPQRYQPAALLGVDAIKLYLGDFSPPEEILVYHAANMSEYARGSTRREH